MTRSFAITAMIGCLLSGCANQIDLSTTCNPPGASLSIDGRDLGTCPKEMTHFLTSQDKESGVAVFHNFRATWVSGATVNIPTFRQFLSEWPTQTFHFERPRDVSGYEIDARYALEYERNQNLQQEVDNQNRAAMLRAAGAMGAPTRTGSFGEALNNSINAYNGVPPPAPPVVIQHGPSNCIMTDHGSFTSIQCN